MLTAKFRSFAFKRLIIGFVIANLSVSCNKDEVETNSAEVDFGDTEITTPDWTDATHSKSAAPDYSIVFPDDEVLRIDLEISEQNWSAMQSDLSANLSTGAGPSDIDFTPIWVPCSLKFNGIEWYQVGIRYKGNSTLTGTYNSGSSKYAFKLDFDEFEDTYPAIENQRFYGFKQLNLGNNYNDNSFMREKVCADIFRNFGVPAARTSFCSVYLDRGNGTEYLGLYALVEEVDNTVPESQFSDDNGNLYKPDGDGASFASGTYNEADMDKKSNEDAADYSDVQGLNDVLHSSNRTSNEAQWKDDLEAIFDVDQYLKYLAVNNTIQNWDTYGRMTHNYFLYNDSGKLVWIPWDNNEAMQEGKMGGALSLSMSEVSGNDWPIIRYIMDIDDYEASYKAYLADFNDNYYTPGNMSATLSSYESLISEVATQESGSFSSEVSELKSHVEERNTAVDSYLNQ